MAFATIDNGDEEKRPDQQRDKDKDMHTYTHIRRQRQKMIIVDNENYQTLLKKISVTISMT